MANSRKLLWIVFTLAAIVVLFCGGAFWMVANLLHRPFGSLVPVMHQDPQLQNAIKEARRTLPQFESRLKKPEPGDRFAIKAKFDTPYGPEYLWMKEPRMLTKSLEGTVDQVPIAVPHLKKGDRVTVPEANVVDWFVERADGSMAGRFTDLALGSGPR